MPEVNIAPVFVGLSTGQQEFSFRLTAPVINRDSFLSKRGIYMNVRYNDVAIGSNPVFELTLRDTDTLYLPDKVYYQVQGQKSSSLQWEDIGNVQTLSGPLATTFRIILPSELTGAIPDMNLHRRLVVEVFYTMNGETIHSTQVIDFDLVSLPSLSVEYEEEQPVPLSCTVSAPVEVGNCAYILLLANKPVQKVTEALITYLDAEEHELNVIPETFLLAGNSSAQFLFHAEGTLVSLACKVKTLDGTVSVQTFDLS